MKKEVMFVLKSKDFLKSGDMFLIELEKAVKVSSLGCVSESKFVYFLDVLASNRLSRDFRNTSLVYSCKLNLCCDKETNFEDFFLVYNDVLTRLMEEYSVGIDYLHDNRYGIVYSHLTFCITRHNLSY